MALDPLLLEVLACPEDKGPLLYFADEDRLYNPRLNRSYEVRDDIPIMLIDEATQSTTPSTAPHGKGRAPGGARPTGSGSDRNGSVSRMSPFPPAAPDTVDSLGMFERTAAFPEQVAAAVGAARDLDGLPDHAYVENVVVLGMGGSGIAGDVMVAVAGPFLPVPVTVVKSYDLPDFVGRGSLVFAISFSGDTEETVEAAGEAADAGASLVAVTSGGELARLAEEWGAPSLPYRATSPSPERRSVPWPCPRWWCWRRSDCSRAPADGWHWRSISWPAGATSWWAAEPGRGDRPAVSGAPSRSSTAPRLSGPPPRCAGRPRSTRTPSAPPSRPSTPSCATTRSPAGASTATSPARS